MSYYQFIHDFITHLVNKAFHTLVQQFLSTQQHILIVPLFIINQMEKSPSKLVKDKKWRCGICEFDNIDELPTCEMCQSPKTSERKVLEDLDSKKGFIEKQPGIICPNKACCYYNLLSADACVLCKKPLYGDRHYMHYDERIESRSKLKLKHCFLCSFENDPSNTKCVKCEVKLKPKVIPTKPVAMFGAVKNDTKIFCEDCGTPMDCETFKIMYGYLINYDDYFCPKCIKKGSQGQNLCIFCDQHLTKEEAQFHDSICQPRASFFKKQGNESLERCTKLQIDTILHMHEKYEKLHEKKKSYILHRIKKLGYSEQDFQNLHHYIMHYAPIIIHMRVQNFNFYAKDTHYRNQFEVRGHCGGRVEWEDRMFDKMHQSATGFERVKYGTMNFTNDPQGVQVCAGYGQSYFLLKKHVRDRCTITDMDSASPTATIATFRFIFHLLLKLSDNELKAAFEGSKGKQMKSNVIHAYKEIQIHGPVEFSKDIERVYICKQQMTADSENIMKLVKEFCGKNKLQYELFDKKIVTFSLPTATHLEKAQERIITDSKKQLDEEASLLFPKRTHPIMKRNDFLMIYQLYYRL